jgi:hypothetical protein
MKKIATCAGESNGSSLVVIRNRPGEETDEEIREHEEDEFKNMKSEMKTRR